MLNYYNPPTASFVSEYDLKQVYGLDPAMYSYQQLIEYRYFYFVPTTPQAFNEFTHYAAGSYPKSYSDMAAYEEEHGFSLFAGDGSAPTPIDPDGVLQDKIGTEIPFFVQTWRIQPLYGVSLASKTAEAERIVADKAQELLAATSTYATQAAEAGHNLHSDMIAYRTWLNTIDTDPQYPAGLAYSVVNGSMQYWMPVPANVFDPDNKTLPFDAPTKAQSGFATTDTNADLVFRRLVGSYASGGTYDQKAKAVSEAVATHGENADYSILLDAANTALETIKLTPAAMPTPEMTTAERDASSAVTRPGSIIWNSDNARPEIYMGGGVWQKISTSAG